MPYVLEDLVVDRVDLVDEGANSAAFIEVFKRKEQKESMNFDEILSKMKPEHAEVIQQQLETGREELSKANEANGTLTEELSKANEELAKVNEELTKANEELAKANEELDALKAKQPDTCTCDGEANEEGKCKSCGKPKKTQKASFDEEEVLKSMPEGIRAEYLKMRSQKEAAEEQVRKAAEEKAEAEAVAKAATLKALPVEQSVLVDILKSCDSNVVDVLSTVAAAIESTVLTEVGKAGKGKTDTDAWGKIEAEADKIVERDSVTKQKAISIAIKENPELYREYLNGGNN